MDSQDENAQKVDAILSAAFTLCSEIGIQSVKMGDIASEAKMSKGTLYRFFGAKEDLFAAMVLNRQRADTVDLENIATNSVSPESKLRMVLATLTRKRSCDRLKCEIVALGMVSKNDEAEQTIKATFQSLFVRQQNAIRSVLESGMESGIFRPALDVDAWSLIIFGCADGMAYRSAIGDFLSDKETVERLLTLIEDSIRL